MSHGNQSPQILKQKDRYLNCPDRIWYQFDRVIYRDYTPQLVIQDHQLWSEKTHQDMKVCSHQNLDTFIALSLQHSDTVPICTCNHLKVNFVSNMIIVQSKYVTDFRIVLFTRPRRVFRNVNIGFRPKRSCIVQVRFKAQKSFVWNTTNRLVLDSVFNPCSICKFMSSKWQWKSSCPHHALRHVPKDPTL